MKTNEKTEFTKYQYHEQQLAVPNKLCGGGGGGGGIFLWIFLPTKST